MSTTVCTTRRMCVRASSCGCTGSVSAQACCWPSVCCSALPSTTTSRCSWCVRVCVVVLSIIYLYFFVYSFILNLHVVLPLLGNFFHFLVHTTTGRRRLVHARANESAPQGRSAPVGHHARCAGCAAHHEDSDRGKFIFIFFIYTNFYIFFVLVSVSYIVC